MLFEEQEEGDAEERNWSLEVDSADYKCKIVNAGIGVRHEALKKVRDAIKKTKKKVNGKEKSQFVTE